MPLVYCNSLRPRHIVTRIKHTEMLNVAKLGRDNVGNSRFHGLSFELVFFSKDLLRGKVSE